MPQAFHNTTVKARANKASTLVSFVGAAAAATVLMLLISAVSPQGPQRLLPDGSEPFLFAP